MLDVHTAARRIMARCDELAAYTSMTDGIERVYLSPEHARVNRRGRPLDARGRAGHVAGRGRATSAGTWPGGTRRRRRCCSGSHLDTVRDAGRYDGILGVLMAIEVVRALRPAGGSLRFGLDVVAFWDEEGARFGTALLGSLRDGRAAGTRPGGT